VGNYSTLSLGDWVPLPAPGGPSSTARIPTSFLTWKIRKYFNRKAVLRIRIPFLTPGIRYTDSGWEKIRIRDEHPKSFFRKLINSFLGYKYLNSLIRIRIQDLVNPGSGMEKIESGPGIIIPDPQHCERKVPKPYVRKTENGQVKQKR
jgi:hypothetical protein